MSDKAALQRYMGAINSYRTLLNTVDYSYSPKKANYDADKPILDKIKPRLQARIDNYRPNPHWLVSDVEASILNFTQKAEELRTYVAGKAASTVAAQMNATSNPNIANFNPRAGTGSIGAQNTFTALQPVTATATPPNQISLNDLSMLLERTNDEILRLTNLRSTSPTITTRINNLTELAADVRAMMTDVTNGKLKLEDVPISAEAAQSFIESPSDASQPIPEIITPAAASDTLTDVSNTGMSVGSMIGGEQGFLGGLVGNSAIQGMLLQAQNMKWTIQLSLGYDPATAARDKILTRITAIEKRLAEYAISETPMNPTLLSAFQRELDTLYALANQSQQSQQSQSQQTQQSQSLNRMEPASTRIQSMPLSDSGFPTAKSTSAAGGNYDTPSGRSSVNEDAMYRPGFIMNDDTIARRGSGAAYDDSAVGHADYKPRALHLCKQIREANLGDPASFGCIANPSEVSSDYSWRGNYLMACNRLGDTWGGWYPEMFGCPPYDPQAKFSASMK